MSRARLPASTRAVCRSTSTCRWNRSPTPETGHRLYPLSIAFPYVAGTVAGVQLVAALSLGLYP